MKALCTLVCLSIFSQCIAAEIEMRPRPTDEKNFPEYIANLVGRDKLCVGPDYVYNYAETLDWVLRNPKNFPPEMGYASPSHMGKPGEIWGVVRELEERFGWNEEEIRGFLGENVMRVYKANWE